MALGRRHQLRVTEDEARAIARALATELRSPGFSERIAACYLDRPGFPLLYRARSHPDTALHVQALVSSSAPERAWVEVVEARRGAAETHRLDVARNALSRCLRARDAGELLPALPTGLRPALRLTFLREQFANGWEVSVDRELGCRRAQVAPARLPGAVVTLAWASQSPPEWLTGLVEGLARADLYVEGMRVAEPGTPSEARRVRLLRGDWAEELTP